MLRSIIVAIGFGLLFSPGLAPAQDQKPDQKIDEEVETQIKLLRNVSSKVRILAAQDLGKMREKAEPAASALCSALLDPMPEVGLAALEAIEKIRPDLYKHLSTLMLERRGFFSNPNHSIAIRELGKMGNKALPAHNFLITVFLTEYNNKSNSKKRDLLFYTTSEPLIKSIRQIDSSGPETIKLNGLLAGPGNNSGEMRKDAILFLASWAGSDEVKRKQIYPLVNSGLSNPYCIITCLDILGSFGPLANASLPLLKNLKLNPNPTIRKAAGEAVSKIEAP